MLSCSIMLTGVAVVFQEILVVWRGKSYDFISKNCSLKFPSTKRHSCVTRKIPKFYYPGSSYRSYWITPSKSERLRQIRRWPFLSTFIPLRSNPLNAELNPNCHFLALLGAHHIFHVSRISVNFPYTNER